MEQFDSTESIGWWTNVVEPTRGPPAVLYHYCSVDAFIKIVTGRALWLTNLFFMNDAKEHFWLRDKARRYVSAQTQRVPDDAGYQWLDTILNQEWMYGIYCACFSERCDCLSQWRAYADDGAGVAIGFSTSHLQQLCKRLNGHLSDLIYGEQEQGNLLEAVFDVPEAHGDVLTVEDASSTMLGRLLDAASRCKSQQFAEEAEWRMVCWPSPTFDGKSGSIGTEAVLPKFRSRNGVITPYIEVPLVDGTDYRKRGMEPIKEVYFGPKTPAKLQEYAAKLMLNRSDFRRVRLVQSAVNIR